MSSSSPMPRRTAGCRPLVLPRSLALLLPLLLVACDQGDGSASAEAMERGRLAPTMPTVVTVHAERYRAAASGGEGRLTGRVPLPPGARNARDTVEIPAGEERACGAASMAADLRAVVWIDDVRAGAALPLERRRILSLDRCRIAPRVTHAWRGDVLTVVDRDPVAHQLRFAAPERGEGLGVARTLREGSAVALERPLARPGLVEVQCDRHPGERAWLVVVDHPYVTVADADGRFALDAVPPGTWRVVAWHPRAGSWEGTVTVDGAAAEVTLAPVAAGATPGGER